MTFQLFFSRARFSALIGTAVLTSALSMGAGAATSLSGSTASAPGTVDLTALGTTDWVHWAFKQPGDINRKVGGGAVIGDYVLSGGASVIRKTTASGYVWADGDPQGVVGLPRRKGLRNIVVGGGFELSVPATSEISTLRLFVGARNVDATLTASLSDGSVTPVNLAISAGGSRVTQQAEFAYASDVPGVTLDISYVLDAVTASGPEHFLEAAALEAGGVVANQPPELQFIDDVTITEGESLSIDLLASDPDHTTGLEFSQTNTLPGASAILVDNGDGTGSILWDSVIGDALGSPFTIDVVVADPEGAEDTQTVTVTVLPVSGGGDGTLDGSWVINPGIVDLTAEGSSDWAAWGFSAGAPMVTKAQGSGEIGDLIPLATSNLLRYTNGLAKFDWSDGDPVTTASETRTSFRVRKIGEGMTFDVAAGTEQRQLKVYVGARRALGRLTATLSDGSAAPVTVDVTSQPGRMSFVITLNYRAATPNATLQVSYVYDSQPISGAGWVSVEAAALTVESSFPLPFSDDFAATADAWVVEDEALDTSSDWGVQNASYTQQNFMGFTTRAMQGAAHVGTLSYLVGAESLTDYRFSVEMQPVVGVAQGFSQDLGVIFRHDPATGNQMRLSFSGANAFGRLERRLAGVFTTLAQNSTGFVDTAVQNVEIAVQGPIVVARLNGDRVFAAYDTELTSGTVGLYCRNACAFDDVLVDAVGSSTELAIALPAANSVRSQTTFPVSAVVLNAVSGAIVTFDIPGETNPCTTATETSAGYFEASCSVSGTGVYEVEATYLDAQSAVLDTDSRSNVGVGDNYIALGDSITAGLDDSTASDAVSANGLVVGTQGFEALLSDRLTNVTHPVIVSNNGVPGDTSIEIRNERIDGVLQRHPNASHLLLTVGVNEAGGGSFLPSGLGCSGTACDGTYKGNVQAIVDAANAAGVEPVVSMAPPRFGDPFQVPYTSPASHPRNELIRDEYNEVVANELSGATVGPDLFRVFLGPENRFYLYQTNLHPNALGYQAMAAEFEAALTGNPQSVFYATQFCLRLTAGSNCQKPLEYKQNLMEPGDLLYVDNGRRLTGTIPSVLTDGRWIQTAHGDRNRSNSDYLTFDVGESATMYVAYDQAATTLPSWLSSGFTATTMSITTSGVSGSELTLYEQTGVLGEVVLGAAEANQHGAAVNYLVILVAN